MEDNKKPDNTKPVPIVSKPVTVVKKSVVGSAIRSFLIDEAGKIWTDAVKPGLKSVFLEFVTAALYGSSDYRTNGGRTDYRGVSTGRRPMGERISYRSYGSPARPVDTRPQPGPSSAAIGSDPNSVGFETYIDAKRVLEELKYIISVEGVVRVSRFYEKCGLPCYYNEEYFGWTSLDDVIPTHNYYHNKWFLTFPRPMPIDRM